MGQAVFFRDPKTGVWTWLHPTPESLQQILADVARTWIGLLVDYQYW